MSWKAIYSTIYTPTLNLKNALVALTQYFSYHFRNTHYIYNFNFVTANAVTVANVGAKVPERQLLRVRRIPRELVTWPRVQRVCSERLRVQRTNYVRFKENSLFLFTETKTTASSAGTN